MDQPGENIEDEEIRRLIEKYAAEYDVPEGLLMEIYEAESRVVGMERRSSIHKDVNEAIQSYLAEASEA